MRATLKNMLRAGALVVAAVGIGVWCGAGAASAEDRIKLEDEFEQVDWTKAPPEADVEVISAGDVNIEVPPERPRLLWSIDELEALRSNVRSGWLADAFAAIKAEAIQQSGNRTGRLNVSAQLGRRMNEQITTLALTGYLTDPNDTGDDEPDPDDYLDAAVRILIHHAETHGPDDFYDLNGHLAVGDATHAFAVGYDWLYSHMADEQRTVVKETLDEFGTRLYDVSRPSYASPDAFSSSTNHNAVVNGALGLAALALGDRDEWLAQAITQTRAYFRYSMGPNGWNFEGPGYWGYGNWGALAFASALENVGGPDLVAEQPKLANVTVDYFLRRMEPYRQDGRGMGLTMYLISKFDDQVGLWGWLQAMGNDGDGTFGGRRRPYALLWADPDLEPLHPAEAGVPLDTFFASERAVMRDGWDELSSLVTFTTGWTRHSGHRMRRDNSFTFHALGEGFAVSPREIMTRMEVLNNLVMVSEPRRSRSGGEHPYGAEFVDVRQSQAAVYIKSDATESAVYYDAPDGWTSPDKRKVSSAQRQLLYGRDLDGDNPPYLLVIDDLVSRDGEPVTFSWLLQTAPDNEPVLDEVPNRYRVIGARRGANLHVEFFQPDDMEIRERSHEGLNEIKGRWSDEQIRRSIRTIAAETEGSEVRIKALLIATEPDQPLPDVAYSDTEDGSQVVITFADGAEDVIDIKPDDLVFERSRNSAATDFSYLSPTRLEELKAAEATSELGAAREEAIAEADAVLEEGATYSVTFQTPEGRPHEDWTPNDFYSMGPYWWPNPDTENGLPYVHRDGEVNPEFREANDRHAFRAFVADVRSVALAYALTDEEKYAEHAVKLLRVWFLDEETRMKPHMRYAQAIPGRTTGRGIGIIDTHRNAFLVDKILLLRGAESYTSGVEAELVSWYEEYLDWLIEHPQGQDEAAMGNNHGTSYDVQVLSIGRFVGRDDWARDWIETVTKERFDEQIEDDGRMPAELQRTRSWNYTTGNLRHLTNLCIIAERLGMDLFHYPSAESPAFKAALDFALPYADREDEWPYEQIVDWDASRMRHPAVAAASVYGDAKYKEAIEQFGWEVTSASEYLIARDE